MRDEFSKETQENARAIEKLVNSFGFSSAKVAEFYAQDAHRTLQQNLTRFCIEWLRVCASEDYRYDGRNEASHEVAKKLLDGHDDIYLPFI